MSGTHSCTSTPWIPWPHMLVILISWCKTIFRCLLYGLLFLFPSLKYATWWVASTTKVKSISCNPHRQPENKNDEQHLTLHTWLLNPKCSHLNIYLNSQLRSVDSAECTTPARSSTGADACRSAFSTYWIGLGRISESQGPSGHRSQWDQLLSETVPQTPVIPPRYIAAYTGNNVLLITVFPKRCSLH